ncbi:uncharacterized protein J3D65DRAFT_622228 [Phyllosticta citribraziliensis]|uniref:Uncharacterized protein n=1 Tax=Phyllosticta citribraziliensis TaxID=989973 RepID=A0ABR1LTL3_9PEZI
MPDTSKKNTNSSSNTNSGKSGNSGAKPSQYAFIKEGWGSRKEFQLSYGLKMTPEDFEEGNRILEGFEKQGAFEKKM